MENVPGCANRCAGRWILDYGTTAIIDEFKSLASICAVALGARNSNDAWVEWLDCQRREQIAVDPKAVWIVDSHQKERRPEPDFEVAAAGLVSESSEIRDDPDSGIVSTELYVIGDVCGESERLCRRLTDETLRCELGRAIHTTLIDASSPVRTLEVVIDPVVNATPGGNERSVPPEAPSDTPRFGPTEGSAQRLRPPTPPDGSKTMTLKEAARALRVSDDTLLRMRKRNEIEMFKVASRWRVVASEVIRLRQHPRLQNR